MKIILVDDDPGVLLRMTGLLTPEHDIVTANDGVPALARLDASFDAIISDYVMPGMNGLDLLQRVHAKYPAMRRVLCSSAPPAAAQTLLHEGVIHAVLKKPATLAQLIRALNSLRAL